MQGCAIYRALFELGPDLAGEARAGRPNAVDSRVGQYGSTAASYTGSGVWKGSGFLEGIKSSEGGRPLARRLAKKAGALGVKFSLIYGRSDKLGAAIFITEEVLAAERADCLSTRMTHFPMVRVEIRDAKAALVASGSETSGEVWVQSLWLTQEYVDDTPELHQAFQLGWLRTGDLAVRYPDESFQVVDRLKDAIKSGGEWVVGSPVCGSDWAD